MWRPLKEGNQIKKFHDVCVIYIGAVLTSIISTAESVQLCYTNHIVVHVVVNNLIRAHCNIIKTS